jgi:hypothetical protein
MVELHRGRIWVEGASNAGAIFFIELPLIDPSMALREDGQP